MQEQDIKYMRRCLELASRGKGSVAPNPLVGCVIVKDGSIIGEGWHKKYGEQHAEVNAIRSLKNESDIEESEVYVNLEPCSYHGNTPPCANMLAELPLRRVIYAVKDPNPKVDGKGHSIISDKGIEVTNGVLEAEALHLNRRFLTFHTRKRPYIILKWAETGDGFIARSNYDSKWISNQYSRKLVHKWRSEESGIMVGANTVIYDNPNLTTRDWDGANPTRIIIDPNGKTENKEFNIHNDEANTIIYGKEDYPGNMSAVIEDLYARKITSVLVEGGSYLLNELINHDLWDEIRRFRSGQEFGEGIDAPRIELTASRKETVQDDELLYYFKK